jgi:protein-S-isoprenylcysteine O-methyltransferase Ste14
MSLNDLIDRKLVREFVESKIFDLAMAAPLILWFGWNAIQVRPTLARDARLMLAGEANLTIILQFFALFASALFDLLLVWLLAVRTVPVRKAKGLLPRLCGFAGTFLGVAVLRLKVVDLSLPWQVLADVLVLGGSLGSALVLSRLGKAFAIMPEARQLVTTGPYAHVRHPLYAVEMITLIGIAIQFVQPWAGLITLGVLILQVIRSLFEEQVLLEAFADYAAYRARTKRFIPGII